MRWKIIADNPPVKWCWDGEAWSQDHRTAKAYPTYAFALMDINKAKRYVGELVLDRVRIASADDPLKNFEFRLDVKSG